MSVLSIAPPRASFMYGWFLSFPNTPSHAVIVRMKYRLIIPPATPISIYAGTLERVHIPSTWKSNSTPSDENMYVKHAAVTLAMSIGRSEAIVRSIINTSSVNTSPAIGALKIPAMAAAAPHPTSSISVWLSILNSLPRLLPIAEPVSTIGASAPTLPPHPMVMAEAITELQQLWALSLFFLLLMAYRMRVIPWLMLSLTMYLTNSDVRKIPITGYMRYSQLNPSMSNPTVSRCCICLMSVCSMLAATAARKPTARLSINVNCLLLMCLVRHSMNWFSSADIFSCMICSSSLSLFYLMIFTSPFSDSFMMLDGLWGLCSCLLDQHT